MGVNMSQVDVNVLSAAIAQGLLTAMNSGVKGQDALAAIAQSPDKFLNNPGAYITGQKAVTGTPDAIYAHGPGGIFSTPGIDNIVINTHMQAMGLDPHLRVFPTVYTNPLYPSLTGFDEDDDNEPSGKCDTCLGGTMQGCDLTAAFGHICRGSDEIHITRTMQMLNRGETTPLTILGGYFQSNGITRMPSTPAGWLEVVTRAEMVKIGILMQRKVERMTWQGDPVNNTANGGYMEFPGMEMLVGTGKVDAHTGALCQGLDSLVLDFQHTAVDGAINSRDIVYYLSMLEWYTRFNAGRMGFMPVTWLFAMRPELWYELTAIWPCKYLTDRCRDAGNNSVITINDERAVLLRDKMRADETITINGRKYSVVLCDGMTEENGNPLNAFYNSNLISGQYASDIFMIPTVVRGGQTVSYWEHLDYSKAAPEIALTRSQSDFWTDGGRYLWTVERLRGCYVISAEMDLRVILRTPQLAGRLDNVLYSPLRHLRSPFPYLGNQPNPYFAKGGVSSRTDPTYYSEWNPSGT